MAQTEREMEDMNKSWEDKVAESGQTSSVSILWLFHIRFLATLRKYEILGSTDLYPEQKSRRCTGDFVLLYLIAPYSDRTRRSDLESYSSEGFASPLMVCTKSSHY